MSELIAIITSVEPAVRDRSLESVCGRMSVAELQHECAELDGFRRRSENLYQRVRALFFLYAIHRFHLPSKTTLAESGQIPFQGYELLLNRRFPEAIDTFLAVQRDAGPSISLSSALSEAYHRLGFQTLADQVRLSVRTVKGNQWMFRTGHAADVPLRLRNELLRLEPNAKRYPVLRERTPVRMDFSHSGWSDIFFLGMDYPEGARVINASVDLAVRGRHSHPSPPIECSLRVIDEPVLRLVSVDLNAFAEIHEINEVFDFARDYLGLIKAAVIAAGLIPPGMEGCGGRIADVFGRMIGPGLGLEIVSRVNDIPKGSRLAVSTNLLGSLIALCMRATSQVHAFEGTLQESDRRIVAARAILGEWIGGSGGGWQDSGGVWPGIKLIQGCEAADGDPENGISRGRLMPQHHVFTSNEIAPETRLRLQDSLVLVHGGMAQNVGPILEMVTEKYLLRSEREWSARRDAIAVLDQMIDALRRGSIQEVGRATHRNFHEPLQTIIPWCGNAYTARLIHECENKYGIHFHGFWMLGGMAGGGMGFIFDPAVQAQAKDWLQQTMLDVKHDMEVSVPFATDPVVYDFAINDTGTEAELQTDGRMPTGYHSMMVPEWLRRGVAQLSPVVRAELERIGDDCRTASDDVNLSTELLSRILPSSVRENQQSGRLDELLQRQGFDYVMHEQLRGDLQNGRLGLAQNRLPATARIEDVRGDDILDAREDLATDIVELGRAAISQGEVAVVTLAAGAGSRWTQGAGVVKALNPFCRMQDDYRSFLDIHLAKTRYTGRQFGRTPVHIVTTGYLTDAPIRAEIAKHHARQNVEVSGGRSVGLRTVPTTRDLRFAWEELPQEMLDEQQQKVRASLRSALMNWARTAGEATDYTDNIPSQCVHPVGHWYEVPNLLLNGTLQRVLTQHPQLKYLMLHNIDTLGASLDPGCLGLHMQSNAELSFEVISRRLEDRGGGLARVDGRVRLVESLAMPRESDEFNLSWYNTLTCWISVDRLLNTFGLNRKTIQDTARVVTAIRELGRRIPTYITLKDVKKRWGNGQEDVFPVAQFEKLWGDMTALADIQSRFIGVSRMRGQQLKDPAQLDGWLRDGSAAHVESLCDWNDVQLSNGCTTWAT
jgi:UTP--glucose-1-phosphate uridylyltransferase